MSKAAELAALIGSGQAQGNKNFVINGAMQVAQRGTSGTTNTGYNSVDRFSTQAIATDNLAMTLTQQTDSPAGFSNSLKVTVTTAESALASDEFFSVQHRIEAQNLQSLQYGASGAKSLTLSFYVKSTTTGTYTVALQQIDGARVITSTYAISSANTWEKKTLTFTGDTSGSFANDNGEGLRIYWFLAAGSDYTSVDSTAWSAYADNKVAYGHAVNIIDSTSKTWQLAGVQLEIGDVATPFEHRRFDDEWHSCQRYCTVYNIGGGNTHPQNLVSPNHTVPGGGGHNDVANRAEWFMAYPVKRSQPTITVTDPTNMRWLADNNAVQDATGTVSFPVGTGHQNADSFQSVTSLPITEVIVGWIYKGSGTYPVITIDSEL